MAVAAGMRAVAAKNAVAEKVIEIEDAVVSYREDVALRGVSLSVSRGSVVGIVGPNGAGKTTLLTLINGLGRIVQGKVRVLGYPLDRGCPASLRARIGYVPQIQNIDPRMP
ncbi:MAG: ATP-binding cassette domain-containing protein, partial [Thermacetogeniaceae bacterium]